MTFMHHFVLTLVTILQSKYYYTYSRDEETLLPVVRVWWKNEGESRCYLFNDNLFPLSGANLCQGAGVGREGLMCEAMVILRLTSPLN